MSEPRPVQALIAELRQYVTTWVEPRVAETIGNHLDRLVRVAAGAGDPRAKQAAENALASAALTVEWLKQLLGCHSPALPAAERLAFAQLLNDKGVLDDAGLLYVRVGVEAELAARETVGAGDRLRLGPAAPGPSAAGGAP